MVENKGQSDLDDDLLEQILDQLIPETREIIDHLNLCLIQLDQSPEDEALTETVKRGFHTMKGSSGFAGLDQLSIIAKSFEYLMAAAMKGEVNLTTKAVHLMYEGLDTIAEIIDKAEAGDMSQVDAGPLLDKVERFRSGLDVPAAGISESDPFFDDRSEVGTHSASSAELLDLYRTGYNQLAALKHIVFSSIHLSDPISMATHLSAQIHEVLSPIHNGFWLVKPGEAFVEVAGDGLLIEAPNQRTIGSEFSETFQRIIHEQLIIWPSDSQEVQGLLTEYHSPVIFPLKMKDTVLGMLTLDIEEDTELEAFQFISQFAAMMISISELHNKVDNQRQSLDEMTGMLYRQNQNLDRCFSNRIGLSRDSRPI